MPISPNIIIKLSKTMHSLTTMDEKMQEKIENMTPQERQLREVYAVAMGSLVTYSSYCHTCNTHYQLDSSSLVAHAWSAQQPVLGQWIQVHSPTPKYWTTIIIQGRGDKDEWVKKIKVAVTMNGKVWENVENGKTFSANNDRNSKVRITFKEPVFGRTLRIYPQEWNHYISLRFEAIYLDLE